ncbi:hypothetical protein B0H13DRAFT_1897576 [Mycena leptocephala]|nr:hypothetical protein B0H13DRAFT_1897576 [Mycena leptocephala]
MSPTASDKARLQFRNARRKPAAIKHALAQEKYREKLDTSRTTVLICTQESREAARAGTFENAKASCSDPTNEEKRKLASELRREIDAEYRERQRQKYAFFQRHDWP